MDIKFLVFVAFFSLLVVAFPPAQAYYMTFYTNNTLTLGENATVVIEFHNSSVGETVVYLNVTTSFSGGNSTNNGTASAVINSTNSTTTLQINTTNYAEYALATGDQTLSINTNGTINKIATVRITNVSSATIEFVENLPPFFLDTKIIAKVTATNSSGNPVVNQTIAAKIYAADGAQPSWGSNTSETNDDGIAYINFTIPSDASSGTYILSLENGVATSVFVIKQYTVTLKTKDTSGADKSKFSPGDQVTIETAVTSNGNPTNVTSVSCDFIDANNLVTNVTGTIIDAGVYQCNLTTSSTAQTYSVRITTTQSGTSQTTYTTFATQDFGVRLAPHSGGMFFMEFGGKKSFTIGQTIQMDIIAINVSSGELYEAGTNYYCNTTGVTIDDVWFASNGTSVNGSVASDSLKSGMYMMSNGCFYEFKLGQLTGVFGIRVNLTDVNSNTIQGQGYFSINKYLLKVEPATMFGGMDFHVLLKPEENASFKLSAYNLTDGSELAVGNITDAGLRRITPLTFTGAISEATVAEGNASFINGSTSKYLNVVLPSNTGPQLLSAWTTVAGENVTGEAFYFAKYIMGFAGPSGTMFGEGGEKEGPGGEEGGPPSGGTIACTIGKIVEFTAMTMDASTMQPVKGVNFLGILEGRNEMTGKSVTHCFDSTTAISNTNGQATFNFTFKSGTGCSDLSGYYFVIFNVSWKDKQDEIPAFFECRQININPSIDPWDAGSTSAINISVANVTYANGSNIVIESGNISFVSLMNFNPNMGGQVLSANVGINASLGWVASNFRGSIKIHPANFTVGGKNLTKWPNGFFDGRMRVCDSNDDACDTGFFGFGIQPFRVYTTWWEGGGEESVYTAGTYVNTTIFAQTNVSINESCGALGHGFNQTQITGCNPGFDIKIMSPKSQADYTISTFNFTNATGDNDPQTQWMRSEGWQKWNASFQLPDTLPKGWYMGFMTVNNTNGSTVDLFVDFRVRSYVVGIPHKERLQADSNTPCTTVDTFNCTVTDQYGDNGDSCGWYATTQLITMGNWSGTNWTYIVDNFGIDPSKPGEVCAYKQFNLTAEDSASGAGASGNVNYSVLVFGNSTNNTVFFKNTTGKDNINIFQLNQTDNVPDTKQYLVKSEGPWYSVFINATSTTDRSSGGLIQTQWGWAGQFEVNKNFSIPFIVTKSDVAASGLNVTIENMVQMETAGFGVVGMASSSNYSVTVDGKCGDVTDSNGIAWVPLNLSQVGKFKPFWKLNNSAGDTGSFDRSPIIDVIAFKTYGQFINLYPQGVNNVSLSPNTTSVYLNGYSPANFSTYYNGTFVEQAGQEFVVDGKMDTWYFTLANLTTSYNTLYIDNDTTANMQDDDDSWGSTSSMTSTDTIEIGIGDLSYAVAEHFFANASSTQNISKLVFYDYSTNLDQVTVTSANQKVPVKLCAQNFQYKGLNATIILKYVNWMSTMGPPVPKAMDMYNVTTDEELDHINTTSLWSSGCVVVKVLPNATTWETGITEITGSVQKFNSTGHSIGDVHQIWAGQIMR